MLAGFIAIMKSIDNSLSVDGCKKILSETSYSASFTGYTAFDNNISVTGVADIGKAAEFVTQNLALDSQKTRF